MLWDMEAYEDPKTTLEEYESKILNMLRSADVSVLVGLTRMYGVQGRGWEKDIIGEDGLQLGPVELPETPELPEVVRPTALHNAVLRSDINAVRVCAGDVNSMDISRWTPLHYAVARGGSLILVKSLLDRWADVSARDLMDWTPLHYASGRGVSDVVRLLVAAGANVNAQGRDGLTPLHCAAMAGCDVEPLLHAGADISAQDVSGRTPVPWVAQKGDSMGANHMILDAEEGLLDLRNKDGKTAMHLAAEGGHSAILDYLLRTGASKHVKDKLGRTPLHQAAAGGHATATDLLISRGADVNAKDLNARTPLHHAVGKEVAELLSHRRKIPCTRTDHNQSDYLEPWRNKVEVFQRSQMKVSRA
jgi:ankyrin repeat protein